VALNRPPVVRVDRVMSKPGPVMSWPTWATWAFVAVIVTSLVTIAATINDIW
jgi:hypothetical protein